MSPFFVHNRRIHNVFLKPTELKAVYIFVHVDYYRKYQFSSSRIYISALWAQFSCIAFYLIFFSDYVMVLDWIPGQFYLQHPSCASGNVFWYCTAYW